MNSKISLSTGQRLSPTKTPGQTGTAREDSASQSSEQGLPDRDTRMEQAEARTEQARTRTEQAEARTEQAETRTEQAKTRTEQAEARTEEAETRCEEAETRTEQAIRASEVSYRRLFEAAQEGILILEADTGCISDVNPFLIKMLGFSASELVAKPIWTLGPFKDIVSNKAKFEQLRQQGYVRYENLPLETREGHRIAVEFVSIVYQAGGRNVIQCNVRDVTERVRVEEQIRATSAELEQSVGERTAQLRAANDELQAFSYSVSHDLRAPLRHVLGFVQLLQKDAGPSLSEQNRDHLTTIAQAAVRMGRLIDDLLAFAHIGLSEMQKKEIPLDQLVQEVLRDFQKETKSRKMVWEIHSLPVVQGDPTLLRLALVNLISNAVKFTAGCAEPKIEIGCALSGGDETVIFVRDNGAGFDPQYAGKLFGVFQRLHSAEEFEGTGIGLANVQRIIQRHGGRIWADGEVGKGATFYFSIPRKDTPFGPKKNEVKYEIPTPHPAPGG